MASDSVSTSPGRIPNLETVALLRAFGVVSIAKIAHLPPAQVAGVIAKARSMPDLRDPPSWAVAILRSAPTIDPADAAALEHWLSALPKEPAHGTHSARRSAARAARPPSQPAPAGSPRAPTPHELEERFRQLDARPRPPAGDATD